MELHQIVVKNYDIGPILKIEKTENGSGNTYFIETNVEKYVAKINERVDFVKVYDKVQYELNKKNIIQSKIIRTKENNIITLEGLVLYEFIKGNNHKTLNKNQFKNAIKYTRKYNETLNTVPFSKEELKSKNNWDKASSLDFIINEFPYYLNELDIDVENKKNVNYAIKILSENKGKISEQKMQLVHSDLGADNFMFDKDKVISIIDFTPEYNHELYSLCQFIYWNYLWDNKNINKDEINEYLRFYNFDENKNFDIDIFYLLLIKAILFRIIGPLMDKIEKNIKNYDSLKKRFIILEDVLRLFN